MRNTVTLGVIFAMALSGATGSAATAQKTKKRVLVAANQVSAIRGARVTTKTSARKAPVRTVRTAPVQNRTFVQPVTTKAPLKSNLVAKNNTMTTPAGTSRPAPVAMNAASTGGAVLPTPGVNTMPVTQAKIAPKKSPLAFKWRSQNALDLAALAGEADADYELRAWDRLKVSYGFSPDLSLSVEPYFFHTWFGSRDRKQGGAANLEQPYAAYMGDTSVVLAHSKLAKLKGDINLSGMVRYNVPTSEVSQKNGELGQFYTGLDFSRDFGPLNVLFTVMGRYYIQQYNTSLLYNIDEATKQRVYKQNPEFRLYNYFDLTYSITKKLSLFLEIGFQNTTYHADPETGRAQRRADQILMNPEISYAFNDTFELTLGLYEEPDMRTLQTDSYVPFALENGPEGYFRTTIKF